MVLHSIRKWADQAMENKPVGSIPPRTLHWLLTTESSLTFIDDEQAYGRVKTNQSFTPQVFWLCCFIIAIATVTKIVTIYEASFVYVFDKWFHCVANLFEILTLSNPFASAFLLLELVL